MTASRVQTRAAVIMSLSQGDRLHLVTQMEEHQVAALLPFLSDQERLEFRQSLASADSTLATCALEAMW